MPTLNPAAPAETAEIYSGGFTPTVNSTREIASVLVESKSERRIFDVGMKTPALFKLFLATYLAFLFLIYIRDFNLLWLALVVAVHFATGFSLLRRIQWRKGWVARKFALAKAGGTSVK